MNRQQRVAHVVVLVAIGVCVLGVPALAQDCLELVGHWPYQPVSVVAVSGDYAYVGSGSGLLITDLSDSSSPQLVGVVGLSSSVIDVAVSGGYAYVVGDTRRWVIDVSTPSAPVVVGEVGPGFGTAVAVSVSGDYAYVLSLGLEGATFLEIFDVSTPSAPVEVALVLTSAEKGRDVAVSGSHAYVVGNGLSVVDVSTPSASVEVGFLSPAIINSAAGVAVSGDYAYVVGNGLSVVDVSTPSAPVEAGFLLVPTGCPCAVAVLGDYAYLAAGDAGLRVVDVSTPSAPVEVGSVITPGYAGDVAVAGGYAYVAAGTGGLRVINVGTPSAPVDVGVLDMPNAYGVETSGFYTYVVGATGRGGEGGLLVFDVSTASAPVEVGFFSFGMTTGYTYSSEVAAAAGSAYVVYNWEGDFSAGSVLRVIDVSTPSAPVELGDINWSSQQAWDVAVSGGHAYVAAAESGLRVIDVSAPSDPVEVGFVDTPGRARGVAVSGEFAYVADWDSGLRVIDLSTPSVPVEVGSVDTPGHARGVAVSGRYAYVADDYEGLRVIDVGMPSEPVEVGFVATPANAYGVAVSGSHAYLTLAWLGSGGVGLHAIDVSTPSALVEVGLYETEPSSEAYQLGVAVSNGYVTFAAAGAGWYVLDECGQESFIPAAAVAAGAQGSFFQTDVEVNNAGLEEAHVSFQWLPRGEDNSEPVSSDPITLAAGQSLRYENVLVELFGLEPDSLGALKMVASTESVIGMSRTYNIPAGETAGTFGQGLPAIRTTEMVKGTEPRHIIFLSENEDSRANVGCVNGSSEPVTINIGLFNAQGDLLESKPMDLGPYSNNQVNRIFEDYAPVNGYVDVRVDSDHALYYCYGSMLDNETSDPTTILPQMSSHYTTFIPAASLSAGLQGSFFQTDVDLHNIGGMDLIYELLWLPRGADNTNPLRSGAFSLAPGAGVRYANVLDEVFGIEPDQVGALAVEAPWLGLTAMSRTYNLPSTKVAGTFGQELPGIPADQMIPTGVKKRIIFMSENDDVRANVGCINGAGIEVAVAIDLYGSDGVKLETKYMMLPPYSNRQINGIFQDYAPINGYVDVRTYTPDASIYCYGSVLDNSTSDPTTVLPQ